MIGKTLAQTVPRTSGERIEHFLHIIRVPGIGFRGSQPSLWDEFVGVSEVGRTVVCGVLGDRNDCLAHNQRDSVAP